MLHAPMVTQLGDLIVGGIALHPVYAGHAPDFGNQRAAMGPMMHVAPSRAPRRDHPGQSQPVHANMQFQPPPRYIYTIEHMEDGHMTEEQALANAPWSFGRSALPGAMRPVYTTHAEDNW